MRVCTGLQWWGHPQNPTVINRIKHLWYGSNSNQISAFAGIIESDGSETWVPQALLIDCDGHAGIGKDFGGREYLFTACSPSSPPLFCAALRSFHPTRPLL